MHLLNVNTKRSFGQNICRILIDFLTAAFCLTLFFLIKTSTQCQMPIQWSERESKPSFIQKDNPGAHFQSLSCYWICPETFEYLFRVISKRKWLLCLIDSTVVIRYLPRLFHIPRCGRFHPFSKAAKDKAKQHYNAG